MHLPKRARNRPARYRDEEESEEEESESDFENTSDNEESHEQEESNDDDDDELNDESVMCRSIVEKLMKYQYTEIFR